jgi:hypothetical protein
LVLFSLSGDIIIELHFAGNVYHIWSSIGRWNQVGLSTDESGGALLYFCNLHCQLWHCILSGGVTWGDQFIVIFLSFMTKGTLSIFLSFFRSVMQGGLGVIGQIVLSHVYLISVAVNGVALSLAPMPWVSYALQMVCFCCI